MTGGEANPARCMGAARRSGSATGPSNRRARSDRKRGDRPDVRFAANGDHDKTSGRAVPGNVANFATIVDDRIIDVGSPLVRLGRRRASQCQD